MQFGSRYNPTYILPTEENGNVSSSVHSEFTGEYWLARCRWVNGISNSTRIHKNLEIIILHKHWMKLSIV